MPATRPRAESRRACAHNDWIDGDHSRTTIRGFYGAGQEDATRTEPFMLDADEPVVLLGENKAPNAGEYLLQTACLTGTIVYHAAARGIVLDGLECAVNGDVDLRDFLGLQTGARPGYERIRVAITAKGDLDGSRTHQPDGFSPSGTSSTTRPPSSSTSSAGDRTTRCRRRPRHRDGAMPLGATGAVLLGATGAVPQNTAITQM